MVHLLARTGATGVCLAVCLRLLPREGAPNIEEGNVRHQNPRQGTGMLCGSCSTGEMPLTWSGWKMLDFWQESRCCIICNKTMKTSTEKCSHAWNNTWQLEIINPVLKRRELWHMLQHRWALRTLLWVKQAGPKRTNTAWSHFCEAPRHLKPSKSCREQEGGLQGWGEANGGSLSLGTESQFCKMKSAPEICFTAVWVPSHSWTLHV